MRISHDPARCFDPAPRAHGRPCRALLLLLLAGTSAPGMATGAGAPAAPPTASAAHVGVPAGAFAQPQQTIEYHFMLRLPALAEADLADSFQARVATPLAAVVGVGKPGRCTLGGYVDSRERALETHDLIVRVRGGQITVKARAPSPDRLLDLPTCSSRKYEVDYFGRPEYSISSEVGFDPGEFGMPLPTTAVDTLWRFVAGKCPALWERIRPVVGGPGGLQVPGVAHMYAARADLRRSGAAALKESSLTVWFFPPTGRSLVELSFTAYVKDRHEADRMHAKLGAALRAAGLLSADQSSKTQQYFAAYFGPDR